MDEDGRMMTSWPIQVEVPGYRPAPGMSTSKYVSNFFDRNTDIKPIIYVCVYTYVYIGMDAAVSSWLWDASKNMTCCIGFAIVQAQQSTVPQPTAVQEDSALSTATRATSAARVATGVSIKSTM